MTFNVIVRCVIFSPLFFLLVPSTVSQICVKINQRKKRANLKRGKLSGWKSIKSEMKKFVNKAFGRRFFFSIKWSIFRGPQVSQNLKRSLIKILFASSFNSIESNYVSTKNYYSWRTSRRADANIWAITCTRRSTLHLSTPRIVVRHSFHSRRESIDALKSSCTTLPSGITLGKSVHSLLFLLWRLKEKILVWIRIIIIVAAVMKMFSPRNMWTSWKLQKHLTPTFSMNPISE